MFVMSCTSVTVIDRAYLKKGLCDDKGQEFRLPVANFEIDHSAKNECKVLCSFISIFLFVAGSLFVSRPFARPEKSSNVFSEDVKYAQTTVLQCHVLIICFFTAQTMMPTGVLLFVFETLAMNQVLF